MSVELRMYVHEHCARTSLVRLNSLSCGDGVGGKGTGRLDWVEKHLWNSKNLKSFYEENREATYVVMYVRT